MNWTRYSDYMESECRQYRIRNEGKPGGARYCLYRYRADLNSFCQWIIMGTLQQAKDGAQFTRHGVAGLGKAGPGMGDRA